ncbi:MAG TPA: VanZ family protein [Candidatus Paceibacterota bacterium]|nr:VanZ family protein [Candidatus Paceibacterota bacterium]
MYKARSFFKYWLPVVLWMILIFSASGDRQSFQRSSRIVGPLLHWMFPNMSEANVDHAVTAARKCAHLTEYAILAILFWRAIRQPAKADPRPWSPKLAAAAVLFVALYASTDEYHQTFVPSREGCVRDVLIDTSGAAIGMFLLWRFWTRRKRSSTSKINPPDSSSTVSAT